MINLANPSFFQQLADSMTISHALDDVALSANSVAESEGAGLPRAKTDVHNALGASDAFNRATSGANQVGGQVEARLVASGGCESPPPYSKLPVARLKHSIGRCCECQRFACWVFTNEDGGYGFRVCWFHMSPEERLIIEIVSREF